MSEILTAREAAEYLKTSVKTVQSKARAGEMPGMKIGRKWRFSRRQLLAWIEDTSWPPEELVDLGIIRAVDELRATSTEDDLVDWEEAK